MKWHLRITALLVIASGWAMPGLAQEPPIPLGTPDPYMPPKN